MTTSNVFKVCQFELTAADITVTYGRLRLNAVRPSYTCGMAFLAELHT